MATRPFATMATVNLLRPLRERDFALLWTGMTVSLLGDGIYTVAVAWQVYELHNKPERAGARRAGVDRRGSCSSSCSRASSATGSTAGA